MCKKSHALGEETKVRLNNILIDSESNNGKVKVILTENREIRSVHIDDALLQDREALEDYLIIALNDAIAKATKINETEFSLSCKRWAA